MVESLSVPTFRVGYTITTDALEALYKKVPSVSLILECLELIGLIHFANWNWSNYGCWSIAAYCCWYQGWLDRLEEPNAGKCYGAADHRVIYSADLAAFLNTLARIIKDTKDLTSSRYGHWLLPNETL